MFTSYSISYVYESIWWGWLDAEFDVFEPLLGVEARTLLANAGEVTMAEDGGIGIVEAEAMEEFLHRHLLSEGTSVGRFAVGIESALIADADAVGIVVSGVSANLSLRSARVEGAVLGDVIVVTNLCEATSLVARLQILNAEVLVHTGSAAMHYNQINRSSTFHFLLLF